MTTPGTQETATDWMLRAIEAFFAMFPQAHLETLSWRESLAQHLGGNWEMVQQARAMPGWTHTTASGEQKITGRGKTPNLLPVDDYEPRAVDLRPLAILPDVRDVVTSYETIVAELRDIIDTQSARESALKARVQNLADLLQHELDQSRGAAAEIQLLLDEIQEETT